MKSDCDRFKAELSAYIDDELSAEQRAEIEAHLTSCVSCRERVAELRRIAAGVAALPKVEPTPAFLAQVSEKLRAEERRTTWIDVLFRPYWLKVPVEALALIAVAATILFMQRPVRHEESPNFARLESREVAKPGESDRAKDMAELRAPVSAPSPAAPAGQVAAQIADEKFDYRDKVLSKRADVELNGASGKEIAGVTAVTRIVSTLDVNEAERVAGRFGGKVLLQKPARRESTNTTDLGAVQQSLDSVQGGGAGEQRFWVELPASKKDEFIAEFERRNEFKARAALLDTGVASNKVLTGTAESLGAHKEPTTVLEIVVVPAAK